MKINYQPGSHISALDSLRGLAVLLVIVFHCFPHTVTMPGWIGVDLFFVLSGFLITGILVDTRGKTNYYRNFIARRTLRIFPLYFFALLICLIILPIFFSKYLSPGYNYYTDHQAWFWLYGQNWLYALTGFPEDHTLVHFWSLAVEEQFYVFWPFIVALFNRKQLLNASIVLIIFSLFFRFYLGHELGLVDPFKYMTTASRMDALLIGGVIALLLRDHKQVLEKYALPVGIGSLVITFAGIIYHRSIHFINLASIYIFIDLAAGCLLILLISNWSDKPGLKWLKHGFFRFLGKYSYGLYVYHYIFFNLLKWNLEEAFASALGGKTPAVMAIGAISVALSVVVSIASFKFLEMPFLKLKKYF